MKYRGTYVIEREKDGDWEVIFSASHELEGPTITETHDPLLHHVSEKIERLRPMLDTAEDDLTPVPVESVPDAPTIKTITHEKEN